jgi:hypothetical protein
MSNYNIKIEIPELVIAEIEKLKFKSKKTNHYAIKLVSVVLYSLFEEGHLPTDYYKPLSVSYIRKVTTDSFYKNCFLNYLQGKDGDESFSKKIFQTDGSYKVGKYEKHFRINPLLLSGNQKEYEIEIEIENLNEIFPEVIKHFWCSVSLIRPRQSQEVLEELILEKSNQIGLLVNGANSAFYNKSINSIFELSMDSIKVPENIRIPGYPTLLTKQQVDFEIEKDRIRTGKKNIVLVYEKTRKGKDKFSLTDIDEFLELKKKTFLKRNHANISNVIIGNWMPSISSTNGRFNHQFTNIDKFCIDMFEFDQCNILSLDLKNSQPTILANLLTKNEKLMSSIFSSKYNQLIYLAEKTKTVFIKNKNADWLNSIIEKDIYKTFSEIMGISREEIKKEMMYFLFTEPEAKSKLKKAFSYAYPEFYNGIMDVKRAFKENFGSSKSHLPIFLQFIESHIFIECIYKELSIAGIPAIPKHDCILFPSDKLQLVQDVIDNCFLKIGFTGKMVPEITEEITINKWPDWYKPSTESI